MERLLYHKSVEDASQPLLGAPTVSVLDPHWVEQDYVLVGIVFVAIPAAVLAGLSWHELHMPGLDNEVVFRAPGGEQHSNPVP